MSSPKVVVVGAGSMFFGRQCIWKMVKSEVLRGGTIALVDVDKNILDKMVVLANKAVETTSAPLTVEASTDRRKVLRGADFVVLTFADRGVYFRGVDCQVSEKYGVRMCSGDTIGPGGIFRALRGVPEALNVARDCEELCPNAWLINYINPTTVLGIALMRHSHMRSFALCDGHHEPYNRRRWLRMAGILSEDEAITPQIERKLDLAIGGVNHFTWLMRFKYDGEDMMPRVREAVAQRAAEETEEETHSKVRFNNKYALALMDIFGAYPTATGHTKEYVPYWQGYTTSPPDLPRIDVFDADRRAERVVGVWEEIDAYNSGEKPMSHFLENMQSDHATDIIENMWGDLGNCFYINSPNRGAVTNMADDAFLELRCDIDMQGPRPQPFGEFPRGLLGLQQQVLDTHELTAEAAITGDRSLLMRAFMTDPIVNSISDAEKIMDELFEKERDALPEFWFKP